MKLKIYQSCLVNIKGRFSEQIAPSLPLWLL